MRERKPKDRGRLLTDEETAKMLGVKAVTLTAQRYRGYGPPYVKMGKAVMYFQSDVDEYINGRRVVPRRSRRRQRA